MIFTYAALCAGLELVFWLLVRPVLLSTSSLSDTYYRVPNIGVEAMAICLLGFFSGPFFATVSSITFYNRIHRLTSHTGNIGRI